MARIVESPPLGKYVTISDKDDLPKPGDHAFAHGMDEEELIQVIISPDNIYGSAVHPEHTCAYIKNRDPQKMMTKEPDKQISVAIVRDDSSYEAHVVTSYNTDYLTKTVNVNDVRYTNKNRLR